MERAILVHILFTDCAYRDSWPQEEAGAELKELARSSGLNVLTLARLRRPRPTPATLLGKGGVHSLLELSKTLKAEVVVFGQDLGSGQQQHLEDALERKVIDRTQLILDIFAQRARSQEGKVQVELAQLRYLLPRLMGKGTLLSRLGGGIGTRGPGEQKLEMDRRGIRLRISRLVRELSEIRHRRRVARGRRTEAAVPTVALVGYTNAGKSTLLNALTAAGARTEERLFSTLDPLTRRLTLPGGQPVLVTDTVGFLHRLPHHLVEAFRATLEEVSESIFLLHVMDASDPLMGEKETAVQEVLAELGAEQKARMTALNKCDRLSAEGRQALARNRPDGVQISALFGEGIERLMDRLVNELQTGMAEADVRIPRAGISSWLDRIYREGQVLSRKEGEGWVQLKIRVAARLKGQLRKAGYLQDRIDTRQKGAKL